MAEPSPFYFSEALNNGLVNKVVPDQDLEETVSSVESPV